MPDSMGPRSRERRIQAIENLELPLTAEQAEELKVLKASFDDGIRPTAGIYSIKVSPDNDLSQGEPLTNGDLDEIENAFAEAHIGG